MNILRKLWQRQNESREIPIPPSELRVLVGRTDQADYDNPTGELRRTLRLDLVLLHKREFPMMQRFQNTLFINENDPSNAVIYDRGWMREALDECGLYVVRADPPVIRGFHWWLTMRHNRPGDEPFELPPDEAPYGSMPPPLLPKTQEPET